MTAATRRLILAFAIGTLAGCGGGLSGVYGGDDCAYKLTFKDKDTVYIQVMGMTELAGQYKVDGDKVILSGAGLPNMVFTRKDGALETMFMGQTMVCRKGAS